MARAGRRPHFGATLLALLAFALLLLAMKVWVIGRYGNATPYWDQWDAEAAWLYVPWLEGTMRWEYFVMPHNEHRILFPRLLALGLLEINGVWNPLLQMLVNALLHTFAIGLVVWLACRHLERALFAGVLASGVVMFGIPYAWANVIGAFQSQFYLLLLLGTASLWLAAAARPFDRLWWGATALALASYFCMASGAITFVTLALMAIVSLADPQRRNHRLVAAAMTLAVAFALAYLVIPVLEHHRAFRAANGQAFFDAVVSAFSWPLSPKVGNALLRNAPGLLLLILVLRDRRLDTGRLFLLGLVAWTLGQSAAAAFGRATSPRVPRVLDLYAWAAFANLLCVVWLLAEAPIRRRLHIAAAAIWMALSLGATLLLAQSASEELVFKHRESLRHEANTRAYVLTGDRARLRGAEIPYPDPERLASLLDRPSLRPVLPLGLQPPLPARVQSEPVDAFVTDGTFSTTPRRADALGSYTASGDVQGGITRLVFEVPRAARLAVPVAGYPTRDAIRIEVEQDGRTRVLSIHRDPREAWRWVFLDASPGPLTIVLTDHTPIGWIAVAGTQVAGRLDRVTDALLERPEWPAIGGLTLLLALLLGSANTRSVRPSAAPAGALVSFVVPAYNEEKQLPATLASIHGAMAAIGRPYEIVVADDASTDETAALATAAGARVVPVEFRQISRTRNAGAKAASGDPIFFVDADTRIDEPVVRHALAALDAGAVGGGAMPRFDGAAPGWSRAAMCAVIGPMRLLNMAAGCFVFVRRAPFEAVGGFDERHFAGEEIMLSQAMKRHGRFVILPDRVETSSRKFVGASPWQTLGMSLRLALRGMRGVRRREGNEFWYDGRR